MATNSSTLIKEKKAIKSRFSPAKINEMSAALRLMKTKGIDVYEFMELFPGNSFFEFIERDRKCQSLRVRINEAKDIPVLA